MQQIPYAAYDREVFSIMPSDDSLRGFMICAVVSMSNKFGPCCTMTSLTDSELLLLMISRIVLLLRRCKVPKRVSKKRPRCKKKGVAGFSPCLQSRLSQKCRVQCILLQNCNARGEAPSVAKVPCLGGSGRHGLKPMPAV